VYRFNVLQGPQEIGKSVIVKQVRDTRRYDPQAVGYPSPAWLMFNEWAGLQFLGQVAPNELLCPRLYAGDRNKGLIVLEDVRNSVSLGKLLLGDNAFAAEEALTKLAGALGRLQALTIGKRQEFDRLRDALGPRASTWGWVPPWLRSEPEFARVLVNPLVREYSFHSYTWMAEVLRRVAEALDVKPAPGVNVELEVLMHR